MTLLSSRWFRIVAITAVLVLTFLVGTPFLIKHLAKQWLLENGGDQVQVEDVDFNPFTATLLLEGLDIRVNEQTTLSFATAGLDLAWLPLLDKQLDIQSVELSDFAIIIDDRPADMLLLGGITIPTAEPQAQADTGQPSAWLSGIQRLTLNDFHLHYLDGKLDADIIIDRLQLERFAQWTPEHAATIDAAGSINGAAFRLDGTLAPLASAPHYAASVSLKQLPLEMFAALLKPDISQLAGQLSFDGELAFKQDEAQLTVSEKGIFRLETLQVALADPAVRINNKELVLDGSLDFSSSAPAPDIQLDSDLTLAGLGITASEGNIELISAKALKLADLKLQGLDTLSLNSISIEQLGVGRSADATAEDAFLHTESLEVTQISFADRLVSIDTIHYTDGHSRIRRKENGEFRIVGVINTMAGLVNPAEPEQTDDADAQSDSAATKSGDATPGIEVAVNQILVSGDSKVSYLDESVKPAFETVLQLQKIAVKNLDTRKPDQKSPFSIDGGIGKHTRIAMHGEAQPFLQPLGLNLTATLHAMDLPALSPYTRESLGLLLDSGTLDMDLTLTSSKKTLGGKAALQLHQLALENVPSENSLQSRIPVPLNVALDTLRDRHNTIKLDIPFEGDADNPAFDISDVISQALATGVRKGALSYLTLALQPYGSLITAAQYAGEAIAKVRLKPIEFEPGQSSMDATDRDYLSKVAQVLKDRPKVAIKLCGVAVQQDVLYLQQLVQAEQAKSGKKAAAAEAPVIDEQQLTELARQRAAVVKDYLVEQFQTPADHLVGCRPRVGSDEAEASPRTDLLI